MNVKDPASAQHSIICGENCPNVWEAINSLLGRDHNSWPDSTLCFVRTKIWILYHKLKVIVDGASFFYGESLISSYFCELLCEVFNYFRSYPQMFPLRT